MGVPTIQGLAGLSWHVTTGNVQHMTCRGLAGFGRAELAVRLLRTAARLGPTLIHELVLLVKLQMCEAHRACDCHSRYAGGRRPLAPMLRLSQQLLLPCRTAYRIGNASCRYTWSQWRTLTIDMSTLRQLTAREIAERRTPTLECSQAIQTDAERIICMHIGMHANR